MKRLWSTAAAMVHRAANNTLDLAGNRLSFSCWVRQMSCDAPIVRSTICKYIVEQDVISYLTANCRRAYYDFYSCLAWRLEFSFVLYVELPIILYLRADSLIIYAASCILKLRAKYNSIQGRLYNSVAAPHHHESRSMPIADHRQFGGPQIWWHYAVA